MGAPLTLCRTASQNPSHVYTEFASLRPILHHSSDRQSTSSIAALPVHTVGAGGTVHGSHRSRSLPPMNSQQPSSALVPPAQ